MSGMSPTRAIRPARVPRLRSAQCSALSDAVRPSSSFRSHTSALSHPWARDTPLRRTSTRPFTLAGPNALHAGLENISDMPLCTTHAPMTMRKMMGSFRLDLFAMHNAGIRSAAAPINCDYPLVPPSPCWSHARSASPLKCSLQEEPEEKWVASMDSASPFKAGAVAGTWTAPLMTPAQSLKLMRIKLMRIGVKPGSAGKEGGIAAVL
ncbi:uncharacterized protein LAESUDRAFT_756223 [Laetiporus sulphureus 93-53]|uniref:Uncharacterized protein n=1 Tax=Laetiporus sulphureus 93-53 TaxID=1314785 RepID=A0A165G9D9_9APHY|nr:uncharacterized protein LAESUDRAFT_756223 [Laetiporus sulphureus 93-53]KZT10018.1 hypothetical protein LAESUDRAFT_756223 [Laetiporus sulphureus 93-53]